MTVGDACAGPPWPVKPESKNPGGIPNVAAELPLCPVCQVPVSPLDWLPGKPAGALGKTAGVVPGEKLSQGVVLAHGSPLPCRGSAMLYTGVVPALTAPSFPETIPAGALAALPWFTVLSGAVLGLIGTGPDIFTG